MSDHYDSDFVKISSKLLNISSNDNSRDSSFNALMKNESNLVKSNVEDEAEGLTLTSMVKNLNEDFKKRKNLEKKEKKKNAEKKKICDGDGEVVDKKSKIYKKLDKKEDTSKKSSNNKYSLAKSSSSSSIASRINSFEVKFS
jgi:transcriptional regulator of acetoin/glycerol metabolism